MFYPTASKTSHNVTAMFSKSNANHSCRFYPPQTNLTIILLLCTPHTANQKQNHSCFVLPPQKKLTIILLLFLNQKVSTLILAYLNKANLNFILSLIAQTTNQTLATLGDFFPNSDKANFIYRYTQLPCTTQIAN